VIITPVRSLVSIQEINQTLFGPLARSSMAGLFFSYYNIRMQSIDFKTVSLFPTLVGSCVNVTLADKVLPFAEEVLNDLQYVSNTWDYKNTYDRVVPDTIIYKELESFIWDVSRSFLDQLKIKDKIRGSNIFFSSMKPGDFHQTHSHPNSILSGVFYLNVPDNSSSLRFYDPRPYKEFIAYTSDTPYVNYDIKPQKGLFLIWQSWLPHEVLVNSSYGRTTAVFNLR
jgi:uncharacterized protein (TIGR02466 family)